MKSEGRIRGWKIGVTYGEILLQPHYSFGRKAFLFLQNHDLLHLLGIQSFTQRLPAVSLRFLPPGFQQTPSFPPIRLSGLPLSYKIEILSLYLTRE